MLYPRDWVITTAGNVKRRDKLKKGESADEELFGRKNSFPEKDDAYVARDEIVDENPSAFLDNDIPQIEEIAMPRKKKMTQEEFQDMMRDEVVKRINIFWKDWAKLSPADRCQYFYKMFAYAYSKAPNAKAVDADADQRKADRKRQAVADAIAQGLPTVEDTNFEE